MREIESFKLSFICTNDLHSWTNNRVNVIKKVCGFLSSRVPLPRQRLGTLRSWTGLQARNTPRTSSPRTRSLLPCTRPPPMTSSWLWTRLCWIRRRSQPKTSEMSSHFFHVLCSDLLSYQRNCVSPFPHERVAAVVPVVGVHEDLEVDEEEVVSGDGTREVWRQRVVVVSSVWDDLRKAEWVRLSDLVNGWNSREADEVCKSNIYLANVM